ncbi:MAG: glycoside hydrolase family 75 protein [Cytophagaceae bacterium]|nr:glycoside hydrolase family 75 protein [Cytophagaceae bacterium]
MIQNRYFFLKRIYCLVCIFISALTSSAQIQPDTFKIIGNVPLYRDSIHKIIFFTSGLSIDADGSPRAYHADSTKGLDKLKYAGKPGNWNSIVTDNGKKDGMPVIQTKDDPAPGYYVSTTSLEDKNKKVTDPRRYVNSEEIAYFVLPKELNDKVKLGDIALVYNEANGKSCYAIFADTGPANRIGEGSIYLAEQLGVKSNPQTGGIEGEILYVIFEGSGKGIPLSNDEIEKTGQKNLTEIFLNECLYLNR